MVLLDNTLDSFRKVFKNEIQTENAEEHRTEEYKRKERDERNAAELSFFFISEQQISVIKAVSVFRSDLSDWPLVYWRKLAS